MSFESFLLTTPDFSDFSNNELELLEHSMRVDEYNKGHVFIEEGEPGKDIYLILDGHVSVSHKRGKKSGWLEIEHLQPGEWFGLISVLDSGFHKVTYTALTKVTVASLPQTAFKLLYNSHIELAHKIQKLITHQVIRDHRALLSVIRKTVGRLENTRDKEKVLKIMYKDFEWPDRRGHRERRNNAL